MSLPDALPRKSTSPPLKFVARVAPVNEITLHGTANLAYWRAQLAPAGLEPVEANGMAQVFIGATQTRFWGIRFREALVGVQVTRAVKGGEPVSGLYLVQAWNSVRAFAWVERTMFGTPYDHARIEVDSQPPACCALLEEREAIIVMSQGEGCELLSTADETWQGPVFLPTRPGKPPQLFIAQLNGRTEHYAFEPSRDRFDCSSEAYQPAIQSLRSSNFTPTHWHLRQAANHAKSKTYRVADWHGE